MLWSVVYAVFFALLVSGVLITLKIDARQRGTLLEVDSDTVNAYSAAVKTSLAVLACVQNTANEINGRVYSGITVAEVLEMSQRNPFQSPL